MAGGALHILPLRFKNIGRHTAFYLIHGSLLQRLVAFQASCERFELAVQFQGVHYLPHLLVGFFTIEQDSPESATGYQSPLHNFGISGQYHPVFCQCPGYHMGIIAAIKEKRVVPHRPQPFDQLAHVMVNDKSQLADGTTSPRTLQLNNHPFVGYGDWTIQGLGYRVYFRPYFLFLHGIHMNYGYWRQVTFKLPETVQFLFKQAGGEMSGFTGKLYIPVGRSRLGNNQLG